VDELHGARQHHVCAVPAGINVRFWHLADLDADPEHVRSCGEAHMAHPHFSVR
jgi:hypothetical protein